MARIRDAFRSALGSRRRAALLAALAFPYAASILAALAGSRIPKKDLF